MIFLCKHTSILRYIFLLLHCIHVSKAERRILDGEQLYNDMNTNYVVYLIKADEKVLYDAWLCGGAIVSPSIIITSAACVKDVEHMYAIAGYTTYVSYEKLNSDECTKHEKRKIIYSCVPYDYTFDYSRINKWANIDIALVKVEKPYNFQDPAFLSHQCSYIPDKIEINYREEFQYPGTDATVFGWGHIQKWRSENDKVDHNQKKLLYGSVQLAEKEECMTHFDVAQFQNIIEKYMICNMDQEKPTEQKPNEQTPTEPMLYVKHCGPRALRIGNKCVYWRNSININHLTRRRGICQNDHGGPIITHDGQNDILIGVASVFKVEDGTDKCIGPFLYTSTYCNGAFIQCVLTTLEKEMNKETRRCDDLAIRSGINITRKTISWIGHPDGPAYNEINSRGGRG